jgi:hypothetical protein
MLQEFRDLFTGDHDCPAFVNFPVFFEDISFNSIERKPETIMRRDT